MKLVVYNKMNALPFGQKSKERTIRFNQSNGVIYISRFLAKEMELKDGDKIIFANDEESKKDWFIGKTNDEYGFVLHSSKAGVRVQSKFICNSVLNATKTNCNATFLVAKEATEYNGRLSPLVLLSQFQGNILQTKNLNDDTTTKNRPAEKSRLSSSRKG